MSHATVTDYFRLHNVRQFKESINETANSIYYVFLGRSAPYANGDVVPDITNTIYETQIAVQDNFLFGKKVNIADVATMVPRYDWISNTVYTAYRSNTVLTEQRYFACVNAGSEYHVFKVLDNNGGTPSIYPPRREETSADDAFYSTADGYQWKYMFTIPKQTYDKFTTENFIPVVPNANVSGNAVSGAIETIDVSYRGSNYNSYLSNTFTSTGLRVGGSSTTYAIAEDASTISDYYSNCYIYISSGTGAGQLRKINGYALSASQKLITIESGFTISPQIDSRYEIAPAVVIEGDGTGAVARAIVSANNINAVSRVEILNRGSGYTWAEAAIEGNQDGVTNTAIVTPVISPKGGHGSDPEAELKGSILGISVTFANTEGGTISVANDFRSIGLIKDPRFANVALSYSTAVGSFTVGERIYQQSTRAEGVVEGLTTGTITLSEVVGQFTPQANVIGYSSNATANVTSYQISGISKSFETFDQRKRYTYTGLSGTFEDDELVYNPTFGAAIANGRFHSIDTSSGLIYLHNVRGTLPTLTSQLVGSNSGAFVTLTGSVAGDLVHGSGEVIYIENVEAIKRSPTQSETIKIVLKF